METDFSQRLFQIMELTDKDFKISMTCTSVKMSNK